MIKPVYTDQLSLNDLQNYLDGRLSSKARHRVERILLEQPFYADALDGLNALQQNGVSLSEHTAGLKAALQERIHESASERRLLPLWLAATSACILLVLSIAIYLIFVIRQPVPRPTQPTQIKVVEVELTPLDSLKSVKTEKEKSKEKE